MSTQIQFTREDADRLTRLEQSQGQQTSLLQQILDETKKTNGRVNKLENNQKKVVWLGVGAAFAISVKTFGLIAVIGKMLGFT